MAETLQERQQRFLERDIERKATEQQLMEGIPALLPKAAWMAGLMAPSSGITDYAGLYKEMPTEAGTAGLKEFVTSRETLPSFVENIQEKRYLDALYQGVGLTGDLAMGAGVFYPPLLPLAAAMKTTSAIGKASKGTKAKGIASLADKKELVKAIKERQQQAVRKYATDEGGDDKFISPTLEALIKRAPQNLKGKQISQWLDANANKGVKPRELEYLGIDEYIANNPNAKVSEVVEGVSENKVKIRKNYFEDDSDYRPTIDFETSIPDNDPLDGSPLSEFERSIIKEDLIEGGEYVKGDLLSHYNSAWQMDYKSFDEIPETMHDEVIESLAYRRYRDNPYELIEPVSTGDIDANIGTNTFAFGNEDTGYQIFVDGERIDFTSNTQAGLRDNTPYSRTEAQIELRNAMEEGGDPLRIEGEAPDYTYGYDYLHKQYVDENLPGGRNYREVSFSWVNAPKGHNIGHIDDENQVAHALVRDRYLDDGTDTLHIDELQSDLHKEGSKYGYEPTPAQETKLTEQIQEMLPDGYYADSGYVFKPDGTPVSSYLKKARPNRNIVAVGETRYPSTEDRSEFSDYIDKIGKKEKYTEIINKFGDTPNYPFKEDYYNMALKELLFDAIRDGKDAISISTSAAMKSRYTDKYHKFYESLYDQKIPSAMKKLAKKYGGEFEKSMLDWGDTFGDISPSSQQSFRPFGTEPLPDLKTHTIKITPKMREKIIAEGLPSFGYRSGGMVDKAITGGSRYI